MGWVRGDLVPDESSSQEILKLRKRIETLEAELERTRLQAPRGTEGLAQGEDEFQVHYTVTLAHSEKREGFPFSTEGVMGSYTGSCNLTWNTIFAQLSPHMMDEAKEESLHSAISDYVLNREVRQEVKDHYPNERIKSYSLDPADFQTIKVHLVALGLIVKNEKQRSVKDRSTYWTLTLYGETLMTQLRAIKRTNPSVSMTAPSMNSNGTLQANDS